MYIYIYKYILRYLFSLPNSSFGKKILNLGKVLGCSVC